VTGATLGSNLVTGVLLARVLGPSGRGELAAILAAVAMVAWLFSVGGRQAASYHLAKRREEGGAVLASWLVVVLPLALVATVVGEAFLPYVLAAQDDETLWLARLLMLPLVLFFVSELVYGVLLGDRDFVFYNVMRLGQPLVIAASLVGLWTAGVLSVGTAVLVTFLASLLDTVAVAVRVFRRHGLRRPSRAVAWKTLWYGLRAHGTSTGGALTTRLDLVIIPAFISAASVGLYSVATNVSWIIVSVSGSLAALVLPAAAAQKDGGTRTVVRSVQTTVAVGGTLAVGLAATASLAVPLVYGEAFADSVGPLRILLPGAVLYAAATILFSGLYAANRPFTAALTQAGGVTVTVVGLLVFLPHGGIRAAAIVSTVAYAVVFFSALGLYRRAAALTWRELLPAPRQVRRLYHSATRYGFARTP
jgi:O-antigen/teichoic acid export membrane protein